MRFRFVVDVEVEHLVGLFASREEIGEMLENALNDAGPDTLTTDERAEYEVSTWEVREDRVPDGQAIAALWGAGS